MQDQGGMYDRLRRICSNLNLNNDVQNPAWNLYNQLNRISFAKADDEQLKIACALFISNFNQMKNSRPEAALSGLKIVQLLQETRVGMVGFFEHLSSLAEALQQGDIFQAHFKALKHNFILISVVFKKYQKLWRARKKLLGSCGLAGEGPQALSGAFELGWYLYLLAKARLGMGFLFPDEVVGTVETDLRTCMHLITATFALMLERPGADEEDQQGSPRVSKRVWPSKLLEKLCGENRLAQQPLMQAWDAVKGFTSDLVQRGILAMKEPTNSSGQIFTEVSGIAAQSVCRQNLLSIGGEYDRCIQALALQGNQPGNSTPCAVTLLYQLDERFVVSVGVRVLMPSLVVGEDGIGVEPSFEAEEVEEHASSESAPPNPSDSLPPYIKTERTAPYPPSFNQSGHPSVPTLHPPVVDSATAPLRSRARPPLSGTHSTTLQTASDDPFTSPTLGVLNNLSPITPSSQTDIFQDLNASRSNGPSLYSPLTPSTQNRTAPPSNSSIGSVFNSPDPAMMASQEQPNAPHEDPPQSPVNKNITGQMEMMTWIQNLEQLSTEPSKDLAEFFSICKKNPTKRINDRLDSMLKKITLESGGLPTEDSIEANLGYPEEENGGSSQANSSQGEGGVSMTMGIGNNPRRTRECMITRSRRLGQALYYSVLEQMLKRESVRLGTKDHSLLLHNESFHRALITCSVEVSLKANALVTLAYPQILTLFEVQAFDVYKVLESFVRFCANLPSSLKKHLQCVEDQILEKRAWVEDSPLFRLLEEQRLVGPWPLQALGKDWERQNPDWPSTVGTLPKRPSEPRQAKNLPPPDRARSRSLDFFFRKLMVLVANRIYKLCVEQLRLHNDIRNQVWTTVKYCLAEHNSILRNRHLDQIILCSIYSICKVNKTEPEVTFRRIIDTYKQEQGTVNKLAVIKDIPLDPRSGNPYNRKGDVIKFYNKIYIGKMKSFVLQFQQKEEQEQAMQSIQSPAEAAQRARAVQQQQQRHARPHLPGISENIALPSPPKPEISMGFLNGFTNIGPGGPQVSAMPMPLSSPQRVNQTNLYLSRTPDHLRRPNTPGNRALYAFGESPAMDLDLINRAVNRQTDLPLMDDLVDEDENTSEPPNKKIRDQDNMFSLS
mmetsp:Transcript_28677/g.37587  ORF Transcript_28677/g.37587 Transcript_28677/m.37587 type:complete len:1118 (-) Transcript_28677:357-3710(-)